MIYDTINVSVIRGLDAKAELFANGILRYNIGDSFLDESSPLVHDTALNQTRPGASSSDTTTTTTATTTTYVDLHGYGVIESIFIAVILSSFIIFAVAGNTLVIVAIVTDRHLRKKSNFFTVSLAVADALVALLVMTFSVANEVLGHWIFGAVFCNVWISSDVMCSTASIMNLCAISLERYIHIRDPFHYDVWVTRNRTLIVIAGIWILSALISFLPIHLGWHRLGVAAVSGNSSTYVDSGGETSGIDPETGVPSDLVFICALDLNPFYAVVSSCVSFYLPCVMMISLYVKLYHYARMHVKSIRKMQISYPPTNQSYHQSGQSLNDMTSSVEARSRASDHKAAVTLGIIMGVFLFCWAPFFTANIIGACCQSCVRPVVFSAFTWLGYINSTMNPVIYSIFNQEFCQAFKRVLGTERCCHRSRGPQTLSLAAAAAAGKMEYGKHERIPLNGAQHKYGKTQPKLTIPISLDETGQITYL